MIPSSIQVTIDTKDLVALVRDTAITVFQEMMRRPVGEMLSGFSQGGQNQEAPTRSRKRPGPKPKTKAEKAKAKKAKVAANTGRPVFTGFKHGEPMVSDEQILSDFTKAFGDADKLSGGEIRKRLGWNAGVFLYRRARMVEKGLMAQEGRKAGTRYWLTKKGQKKSLNGAAAHA